MVCECLTLDNQRVSLLFSHGGDKNFPHIPAMDNPALNPSTLDVCPPSWISCRCPIASLPRCPVASLRYITAYIYCSRCLSVAVSSLCYYIIYVCGRQAAHRTTGAHEAKGGRTHPTHLAKTTSGGGGSGGRVGGDPHPNKLTAFSKFHPHHN